MLKGLDRNKKRFYSRILGLLLLCNDIHKAKTIIENMFIVLLNRFQHSDLVINSIKSLKEVTDTHQMPADITNDTMPVNRIDSDTNIMTKKDKKLNTHFHVWIRSLVDDIKSFDVNMDLNQSIEQPPPDMIENPFYAHEIEDDLVVFLSKIHL